MDGNFIICMHGSTFFFLRQCVESKERLIGCNYGNWIAPETFMGYPILVNNRLSKTEIKHRRWVFPTDRFVRYEPNDEVWCSYFGIGHEEKAELVIGDISLFRQSTVYVLPDGRQTVRERLTEKYYDPEHDHACRVVQRLRAWISEYMEGQLRRSMK